MVSKRTQINNISPICQICHCSIQGIHAGCPTPAVRTVWMKKMLPADPTCPRGDGDFRKEDASFPLRNSTLCPLLVFLCLSFSRFPFCHTSELSTPLL